EAVDMDRALAAAGDEGFALEADEVADVDLLVEEVVGLVADVALAQVALDAAADVAEVEEGGLAHVAAREHAAGDAYGGALGDVAGNELRAQAAGVVGDLELAAEGRDAAFLQFL